MADSEITEQSGSTDKTSNEDEEARASMSELMEKMWTAVETGKDKELRKFFSQHGDRDIPVNRDNEEFDEDGGHILIFCVKEGCSRGNSFGRDFVQCVRILLNSDKLDIDVQDKSERTALHWAVLGKNANFCSLLKNAGADPTIEDHDGLSPFHIAVQKQYKDILKILSNGQDKEIFSKKDGRGTPPLVTAVNTGNAEICRFLLENGAKIDATDRKLKRSALQYAILAKNLEIFDILLKYNPSLDQGDYRGKTALHRICAIKDPRYFQRVIKHYGTFPDHIMEQETDDGVTPVIAACQSGNSQQLKELIDQGASIITKDDNGRTALHYCADNLETQCAEMLLAKDSSLLEVKDSQGFTPLHMSVISGNAPLLKLLLKKGADIRSLDNELHTPTHWATVCGHLEILDILVDNGAELSSADSHNAYPIHYAAQMNGKDNNHSDSKVGEKVLKKLLDSGVPHDVTDKDGRQPLLWAASAGNIESIKLLVKAGADVNAIDKDGLSALHCASSRGHSHCIEEMKKLGAEVNLADKNSCTPLFYAVTLGNKECTKALLKHGADPNHKDVRGRTPSHCASVKGCVETLKILDKSKADLWGGSSRGDYPIHEAAQGGHCDVVKYLLKWKNAPDAVNTPNNAGRTCLHISAIVNNLPLCKLLLDNGADRNSLMMHKNKKDAAKDKSYTPYDAAILKENRETAEYIKSKGGQSGGDIDNILNKKDKRDTKSAKSRKSNLESHKEEEEGVEQDKKSEKQEDPETSEKKEEKPKSKKELEKEKKEAEKAKKEEEKKKKEEELKAKKEEEKKAKEEEKRQQEEEKKQKEEEKRQKEEEKRQKEEAKKKEQESKGSKDTKSDNKEEAVAAAAVAVVGEEKEKENKKEADKKGDKEEKVDKSKEKDTKQEDKDKEKGEKKTDKEENLESDEEIVVVKGKKVVRKKKGFVKDKEAEKARKEAEEAKKDAVKAHQEAEVAKAAAEKVKQEQEAEKVKKAAVAANTAEEAKQEKDKKDNLKNKSTKQKKDSKEESSKGKGKEKTKKDEKAVVAGAAGAKNKKGKKDPDTIKEEEEEEDETTKESGIEAEKAKREAEKSQREAEKLREEAEEANTETEKLKKAAVAAKAVEEAKQEKEKQDQQKNKSAKQKKDSKEESSKGKGKEKTKKDEKAVVASAAVAKNKKGKKDPGTIKEEEDEEDEKTKESGEEAKREAEESQREAEKLREEANTETEKLKNAVVAAKAVDEGKESSKKHRENSQTGKDKENRKTRKEEKPEVVSKDIPPKSPSKAKESNKVESDEEPGNREEKGEKIPEIAVVTPKTPKNKKLQTTKDGGKQEAKGLEKEKSIVNKVDKSKKSTEKAKKEKEKTTHDPEEDESEQIAPEKLVSDRQGKEGKQEKKGLQKENSTVNKTEKSKKSSDKNNSEKENTFADKEEVEKKGKKSAEKPESEEEIQEYTHDTIDVANDRFDSGVHTPGSVAEEEDLDKHLILAKEKTSVSEKEKTKEKKENKKSKQSGPATTSTPKVNKRPSREENKNKVSSRDSGRPNTREKTEFQEIELKPSRDSGNQSQSEERNSQTEEHQSQTKRNLVISPSISPVDYQEHSPHRKNSYIQSPKSRVVHTDKQDDEDEFEFPENSHESQEVALRLAESRKQSRQETLPETSRYQDSPERQSRSSRKASKIPDSGVIQPGLKSRDNSRSKTPVLTNGHSQQQNDYAESSEEDDDDVITDINFQNRLKRIERAQLTRNRQKEQYLLQQLRRTQKPNYKLTPVRAKSKSNLTLADMERLDTSVRRKNVPRRVASIQESVRRYQDQRRFVRQMHQLKRAQIYTGPMHDIVLFSKMMDVYKHSTPGESENDLEMSVMDNWDGYLRDQLRFVSQYYDEDQTVREQTNKVRRETSETRKGVESRSEYLAQSLKRKDDQDSKEKQDIDGRISNITRRTEEMYDSFKEKADQTLRDAKETNVTLDKSYRKERSDIMHNSRPHSYRKLKDEEEMDERQRFFEEREKTRKDKHSDWHKRKEEELRKRLMKVYGNGSENGFSKSRNLGPMKSSTPRVQSLGSSSGSRPKSMMSSISGSRAQYTNSTDQDLSVHMTEFGLRRVKKTDDGAYGKASKDSSQCSVKSLLFHKSGSLSANWTPKFDGDVRPRAGLVFVEPKVYTEFLKEEAQLRQQTAMMARSRSTNINTLDDDATVLETVES
ncbi:titin homolog isoform X3 [Ostrea edulis]|uniref:titin homolog isoform X3 n=1 Tax=Ostrea edulis TaxID=37623 RepID=UPI002095537A|nr:titin homolog isoform X3 [Ostrea edulis]